MKSLYKYESYASFALRYGLAFTLLWSVFTKLTNTEKVVGMFQALGLSFMSNPLIVILGIGLAILAILLVLGKYLHISWCFIFLFLPRGSCFGSFCRNSTV